MSNESYHSDVSKFAFDDEPTNAELPVEDARKNKTVTSKKQQSSHSPSPLNGSTSSEPPKSASGSNVSSIDSMMETLRRIEKNTRITGFESSVVVTGLKNAKVYTELSEMPWRADFTGYRKEKQRNPLSNSRRPPSLKVDSIEQQRAGSGQQGGQVGSGSSARHQPRPPSAAGILSEGDDEVFYNPHDTRICPYVKHHRPHGSRKMGISSYDDIRYSHKSAELLENKLMMRSVIRDIRRWNTYGEKLARLTEKERMELIQDKENLEYCVRKHLPCHFYSRYSVYQCSLSPSGPPKIAEEAPPIKISPIKIDEEKKTLKRGTVSESKAKKPFVSAAPSKPNHVTFSMPANQQILLSLVRNSHPSLLPLVKDILETPKSNNLAEDFLVELNKRIQLLEQRLGRLERVIRAVGKRLDKLKKDIEETKRDLHLYNGLIAKLGHELDGQSEAESPARKSQQPHNPRELNAIKILQRVFRN